MRTAATLIGRVNDATIDRDDSGPAAVSFIGSHLPMRTLPVRCAVLLFLTSTALFGSSRLASNGFDSLLTWSNDGAIQSQTYSPDGVPLGDAVAVGRTFPFVAFSTAFGRSTYLTVWRAEDRLLARRSSADGLPIDDAPFILGNAWDVSDQAIAWDGSRFFVVWVANEGIVGAWIDENGATSTPRILVALGPIEYSPRVVWDGRRFLLTYVVYRYFGGPYHSFMPTGIAVARIDRDGALRDAKEIVAYAAEWHLASSGRETVLVTRSRSSFDTNDFASRIVVVHANDAALEIDPGRTLFEWSGGLVSDVIWDGGSYVVAMRYGYWTGPRWLAVARFTAEQTPRLAAMPIEPDYFLATPAIATNMIRQTLIAIPNIGADGATRVRIVTENDLRLLPPLPPVPTGVKATTDGRNTIVTWESPSQDAAFLVEQMYPTYTDRIAATAVGARSVGIPTALSWIRMRAFNAAGESEPSPLVRVAPAARRRASGR